MIIGSQAIHGEIVDPPDELLQSMEVDMYPLADPDRADDIDGALGDGSWFGPATSPTGSRSGRTARGCCGCSRGGFENLIEAASVPAETPTVPPPSVLPPENVAENILRHGNEVLPG